MDEEAFQTALALSDKAEQEFEVFLQQWCPPAKRTELWRIVRDMSNAQHETVSYLTEREMVLAPRAK